MRHIASMLVLFASLVTAQPLLTDGTTIMPIGNSITDKWGPLPYNLEKLFARRAPAVTVTAEMEGAASSGLYNYVFSPPDWDPTVNERIRTEILSGNWDYVLLQPGGGEATNSPQNLALGADSLKRLCERAGARCLLWSVHTYTYAMPEELATSHVVCSTVAQNNNSIYAPVALVWDSIYQDFPPAEGENFFLMDDVIHQNMNGSVVIAMTLYSTLTGEPAPLGAQWETAVPQEAYFRDVAWAVVQKQSFNTEWNAATSHRQCTIPSAPLVTIDRSTHAAFNIAGRLTGLSHASETAWTMRLHRHGPTAREVGPGAR
jgi:hypothetical protein